MMKTFKKVPIEDIAMVYENYCLEENMAVESLKVEKTKEIYQSLLDKGCYTYACYIENQIVGTVNVYKNMQYYPTDQHAPYVHLECGIVRKEYQSKGIGSEMMINVVNLVKSEGCTYIICQSSEPAAQRIIQKAGLTDCHSQDFRLNCLE